MRKITTLDMTTSSAVKPKQKVAAYIRVSTSTEEQLISLEAQRRHYKTFIEENDDWQLVGIYSDEGITGTKMDRRPELLRLISDCEKGKIKCAECGDTFKRRIHTSTHKKYIAWCCSTHIKYRDECSMLFIREERIHQAFITMMNKLKFGYSYVLIPLSKQLETSNQDENYQIITEIEEQLEITKDELNTLIQLMTKGFLEPAIFNEQKIELTHRHMRLKEERDQLLYSINDGLNELNEVKRLIKYFKQGIFIDAFDEESFQDIVKKIIVYSPNEIGFHLNCGITLRERIDR